MGYDRSDSRYGRDAMDYAREGRSRGRGRYTWPDEGSVRNRGRYLSRDHDDDDDRGFFDRATDEVRSWFGDDEAERRREYDERERDRREREFRSRFGHRDAGSFRDDRFRGGRGSDEHRRRHRARSEQEGHYLDDYHPGGYGLTGPAPMNRGDVDWSSNSRDRAPYAGGTYQENASDAHDPQYLAWRRRQIEELDRDYDEYRYENQSRFDSDFATWRTTRQSQRDQVRRAREQQEVVGSDGVKVGTVDHVRGDRILLNRMDEEAGGRHHSIPCSWIGRVDEKVELNLTAEQAKKLWKDEEGGRGGDNRSSNGPHVLNQSFSGTYRED